MLESLVMLVLHNAVYIICLLILIGAIYYAYLKDRPSVDDSIAHWHATIPDLTISTDRFYKVLEAAIEKLDLPGVQVRRSTLQESNRFGYGRPYLRVQRSDFRFYVFAAPIGESCFISSWLIMQKGLLIRTLCALPLIGWMFRSIYRFLWQETFFLYDSALHFHELMHHTLLTVVDALTSVQQLPALPPEIRKPVMRELYARPKAAQLAL